MFRFTKIFSSGKSKSQWDRSSIGIKRGSVGKGKYSCWEAAGPLSEAWTLISPEVKECVESSCKHGSGISFGIYMIGVTEDKAEPKILFCSIDVIARKAARKAVMKSGIMETGVMKHYPPIGLGDASTLPDLLARESVTSTLSFDAALVDETPVFSMPSDTSFGRRLFIPNRNNDSLRPATGGPILYIKDKIYQLTAGHAFSEFEGMISPETSSPNFDDCDFDGMSDSEDGDSGINPQIQGGSNSSFLDIDTSSITSQPSRDSGVDLSPEASSVGDYEESQNKAPTALQNINRVGKLALHSESSSKQSLDYALVELDGEYPSKSNEIRWGVNAAQRFLQVRPPMKIPGDVPIVTITASSKFLSGKLGATAFYMRLPNQTTFQELYSVCLDGSLQDGDCGSSILDQSLGHFYGHIVAGYVGTGLCYIVPALQVFEDIKGRLDVKDLMLEPLHSSSAREDWKGQEPVRLVEIGSKKYLSELKESAGPNKNEEVPNKATSIHHRSNSLMSAIDHQTAERVRRQKIENPAKSSRLQLTTHKSRFRISKLESKKKANNASFDDERRIINAEQQAGLAATSTSVFEQQFFALPSEVQVQIIAFLSVPDIIHLRLVSRNWHSLVSINDVSISRTFLKQNQIPRFALSLYPTPPHSNVNLQYICKVWNRVFIAAQLSSKIAQWITQDQFLLKTEKEILEFLPQQARMRRRLIPLIFTISHFLENYHNHRLINPTKDRQIRLEYGSSNPVEAHVVSKYDNKTLLQVHQIFPLLVEYLRRMFRPPSYFGSLERSARGYRARPPTDEMLSVVLGIGGLKQVVKFSEIDAYEARISAINEWHSLITGGEIEPRDETGRWLKSRRAKQSQFPPSQQITRNTNDPSSAAISAPPTSNSIYIDKEVSTKVALCTCSLSIPIYPIDDQSRRNQPSETTQVYPSNIPLLQQLWLHTSEALLLKRGVVERKQDIKKNAQLLEELVCETLTDADELSCERAKLDFNQEHQDRGLVCGVVEELVYFGGESLGW